MTRSGQWAAMGGVVLLAAVARFAAFTGPSFALGSDESRYIGVAHNLSNGFFPVGDNEWFGTRIVLLWPVAALFAILGSGDVTAALWPFVGSLTSVAAAFAVGRELRSPRVGLVAAAIVALAPLEVLVGTTLRPDALMPGLVGLAIWAALRTVKRPGWWWPFAAGAFLGLAWSTRESALVMAPIVVLAMWPKVRRAAVAALLGLLTPAALSMAVFAIGSGDLLRPVIGAGTEGDFRNPIEAYDWDGSYLATALRDGFDPGSRLFLLVPVVAAALAILAVRRDRRALFPGIWCAWAYLYLEFGTLVNLGKPLRYLTLCTIPAALLVALAVDGRFAAAAPAVAAVAAACVLWTLPGRDGRHDDVTLAGQVAEQLRDLPPGPIATASYTWWAKLTTYSARARLPIRRARDPEFITPEEARVQRILDPLPVPISGGYIVTGPYHQRSGWPVNWSQAQRRLAAVPRNELVPVSRIQDATIWRWQP